VVAAAIAACATGEQVDTGSPTSFSGPTSPTASASASAGSSETEGDSSGDATSTAGDSGPAPSTNGATAGDDAMPGPGMQPVDGMYSDCLMAAQCVGLNTCVTILDANGDPTDGFCSNNACADPVADCDPTPAGDTVPICMALTLNGEPDTVCALDCSNDVPCPGEMTCWDLNGISICA
jgi:hypothetical protein